ncbi:PREDICTED: uncharacterized protein LOC105108669 [Populus euphratica]|uniref:Uncharacterized protein LOC105108669 n=1 Tax=Populus euphratica TaxID=75702 RepID=A0AAJ6SYG4_POPEU|nr:PREDICTED: uncharacterized protein LOC105108669 [Populus euphratica]
MVVACLLRSSALKNIKSFVEFSDEIPFAKPIPRGKSISLRRNSIPLELNELGSRGLHIPRCEKKREGELVLWEKSDLVGGGIGSGDEFQGISWENERTSGGGGDLAMERGRVRFRIGEVGGAQKGGV